MKMKMTLLAALVCLSAVNFVEAQSLPTARPEQVGLSSERLNRLTATLKADIDKGVTEAHTCQQDEGSCLPRKERNQRDG